MLVLTRKLMEKLFIGDDICVTVVRLEGGQVRLGIEAPREITVVRAELVPERLSAHGKTSAATSGSASPPPAPLPLPRPTTPPPNHVGTGPSAPAHGDFKNSPTSAHGNDIRRRGRFR